MLRRGVPVGPCGDEAVVKTRKAKRHNPLPAGFSAELKRLIKGGLKAKDAMREAWRKFRGKATTANPRRVHRASRVRLPVRRARRSNIGAAAPRPIRNVGRRNPAQGTEIYASTEPFTMLARKGDDSEFPDETFQHKHEGGAKLVGYPAGKTIRAHPTKRVCLEHPDKDLWDEFEQNPHNPRRRRIHLGAGQVVVLPKSRRIRVSRKGGQAIVRGPLNLLRRARVASVA